MFNLDFEEFEYEEIQEEPDMELVAPLVLVDSKNTSPEKPLHKAHSSPSVSPKPTRYPPTHPRLPSNSRVRMLLPFM